VNIHVPQPYSISSIAAEHLEAVSAFIAQIDLSAIERAVEALRAARDNRATIFIAGNGGSAATASHWVNDLGKATKRSGRAAMRVLCLADNMSWLSALANDEGYDRVFAGQLENFAEKGDVLVVISASGNSRNLIAAVELARRLGVRTIGLLGFDGGKLRDLVDECVMVESRAGAYEAVEDAHSVICHAITKCLVADRGVAV
jgi:D-sedoheptulose 7-phosphate isomerase